MHCVQSYLYILENEYVTLGDEFLSVDQLLILGFFMSQSKSTVITKRNDLIKSFSLLALFLSWECMMFSLRISW